MRCRWVIKAISEQARAISRRQNISAILAQVLLDRDVPEDDFGLFLKPALENLDSPSLLPDIDKAVSRIQEAVSSKERVLVYGDYDVDGVTALAIFNEFAKKHPGIFDFYIPHRLQEGYGLNSEAVVKAADEGFSLILAFDCGTNSCREIELAKGRGIDVIVVDHHLAAKDGLASPYALVNPKQPQSQYPFKDLSAGGLSFKFLQALTGLDCREVLDLAALSTVCDVVPLRGENRIIVKEGLAQLRCSQRQAIKALCQVSSLKQENIDAMHLGFILGPRINACGRMAHANEALQLFLSEDLAHALELAGRMQEYNRSRKDVESAVLKEAESLVETNFAGDKAIVVHKDGWHAGVLGIVAGRLADKYCRPAFVISLDDERGKGSGRSPAGVHLMDLLAQCSAHLKSYGGHQKAAGIHIDKTAIEAFRLTLNSALKEKVDPQALVPSLSIQAQICLDQINLKLVEELESLKPFGEENPKPLFVTRGLLKRSPVKKAGQGYYLWVSDGAATYEAGIYDKDLLDIIEYSAAFDAVFSIERNTYRNEPRLTIKDARINSD